MAIKTTLATTIETTNSASIWLLFSAHQSVFIYLGCPKNKTKLPVLALCIIFTLEPLNNGLFLEGAEVFDLLLRGSP